MIVGGGVAEAMGPGACAISKAKKSAKMLIVSEKTLIRMAASRKFGTPAGQLLPLETVASVQPDRTMKKRRADSAERKS
jgi:hypothetical protein